MSSTNTHARLAPTEVEIHPILSERWSPRAFDGDRVVEQDRLNAVLEAARWSPSAYNAQPWRFIIGHRGTATFDTIFDSLIEFNQGWAANASVLIVNVAQVLDENGKENPTASYDLGQAVAHLSIQAHVEGLSTHQMSGFDPDAVADSFGLPDALKPISVTALGYIGDASTLSEALQERESAPRTRQPLSSLIITAE